jgi:hypothetical protein
MDALKALVEAVPSQPRFGETGSNGSLFRKHIAALLILGSGNINVLDGRSRLKFGLETGMALQWRHELVKVAVVTSGIVVFLVTSTPQTPENLIKYLEKNEYAQVQVIGPATRCGKGRNRFAFVARNNSGASIHGEVCMDSHAFNYDLKEAVR